MSYRRGSSWKGKNRRNEPPPPPVPDISDPIGEVNLANKDVKIYLVKMPQYLAQQFESRGPGQNEIVGRLRLPGKDQKPKVDHEEPLGDGEVRKPRKDGPRIFLDNARGTKDIQKQDILTEYELEFQHEDPKVMVFSQMRKTEKIDMKMEGVVNFLCSARPKFDDKFRSMNKRRTNLSLQKTRELKRLDDSARIAADREALKPMSMTETTKQREEKRRQKDEARRHLDVPDAKWREMARVDVFKAFEIQPHYTAEEVARVANEPLSRLRSVINEVCNYNKSGPFAGKYELKDEFKTVEQRKQKEQALEDYKLEQVELVKRRREERAERERLEGPAAKRSRLN